MMNKELERYIKDNLVKEKKFHFFNKNKRSNEIEELDLFDNYIGKALEEKVVSKNSSYGKNVSPNNSDEATFKYRLDSEYFTLEKDVYASNDIKEFIDSSKDYNSFQKTLFKMIDDRNLKDSDVYNKVHLDRRLFSKIRNDSEYHPSKETVLLLGLSLELNEKEIEELLNTASYSLPKNNHYDLIMRFCFMKGIYKLMEVNDLLDQYNCKLFNY